MSNDCRLGNAFLPNIRMPKFMKALGKKALPNLQNSKQISSCAAENMEKEILEEAFHNFLDRLDSFTPQLEYPLPYDLCNLVDKGRWRPVPFISLMISGDLRETINQLNSWGRHLISWAIWLQVLEKYDEDDAWLIRDHFIESIAFFCMFQPSSTRDRLIWIVTNAIHQANLSIDPEYTDCLEQDKQRNPNIPLPRKASEEQLKRLGHRWSTFSVFDERLRTMDSKEYRAITRDFRNLASHKIAPRFELGETNFVRRSIVPKTELIKQLDGTYQSVEDLTRKVVRYGFGGTEPLSLCEMHEVNKKEYDLAVSAFHAYQDILREILDILGIAKEK